MTTISIVLFALAACLFLWNSAAILLLSAKVRAGHGGSTTLIPAYLAVVLAVIGFCLR